MSKINIPKLRFKEFSGEWEEKKLGEIGKINPKSSKLPNEFIYIDLESVEKGLLIKENKIYNKSAPSRAQRLLKKEDILFQMVRPYQKNNYFFNLNSNYVASTGYAQLRTEEIPKFLYYNLHTNIFVNIVNSKCTGTSYPAINSTDLSNIKIKIPQKQEQQKIASFLTTVDKKIEQLTKKVELQKQYKKGVMGKIFKQEIRFKNDDGSEFEEWEEEKLKNYLLESKIKGSKGDKAKKLTVKLWGQGVYAKDEIRKGSTNTQYYKRKSGQLIYSKLDFLNCAFALIPKKLNGYESTVDLPCFDFIKDVNKELLLERIKQKEFYIKNGDIADGSRKAKRIHSDTFLNYQLFFPCLQEQTKIANFLSSLDKKIDSTKEQLAKTKEFKKGLLQNMFV